MRGSGAWPLLLLARHCPAVPGRLLPAACLWTPVTRAPGSLPLLTGLRAARPWGAGPGLVVGTGGARCLAGGPEGPGRGATVVRLLGLWARPRDACRCGALLGPGTRRLLSAGPPGGPAAAARAGGEAWRRGSAATAGDDSRLRPAEVRRSDARKLLGLAYPERGRLAGRGVPPTRRAAIAPRADPRASESSSPLPLLEGGGGFTYGWCRQVLAGQHTSEWPCEDFGC